LRSPGYSIGVDKEQLRESESKSGKRLSFEEYKIEKRLTKEKQGQQEKEKEEALSENSIDAKLIVHKKITSGDA
jgi:hypothetical protein